MYFAVLKPDKTPIPDIFPDMSAAQRAIEELESCPIAQGKYQIHPISRENESADLERINIKAIEIWTLEKFDGEYVGQAPVEVKVILPEI
jgi:hypothetical protein